MTPQEIAFELAEPFDPFDVKFKPQSVKGAEAMVVAFVDARAVQKRLDAVVGVVGWQDQYDLLPDGSVKCELSINFGTEESPNWVRKSDCGSQSEQPDGGDRMKAAFSDALKRAAVKFGIGRYLYSLGFVWWKYDAQRKQIENQNELRATLPRPKQAPRTEAVEGGTVRQALPQGQQEDDGQPGHPDRAALVADLTRSAQAGTEQLQKDWAALSQEWRQVVGTKEKNRLKKLAAGADAQRKAQHP